MRLITGCLKNSTAVIVGMILVMLFGFLAMQSIPIQLNPTIESPTITVQTIYPGASASEVEQEITRKQEEQLSAVEELREMRSESSEGQSVITLKFDWGVNKDLRGLDVLKKLNLVEDLPDDAEEPQILFVDRFEKERIMWLYITQLEGTNMSVDAVYQIVDDRVVPQLQRISGVAEVEAFGGAEREIQVLIDPQQIAARDLTLSEIAQVLARENRNVRGGDIDQGDTRLIVRTPAQYNNLEEIRRTVVANGPDGPVRIEELGEVVDSYKDKDVVVRVNGNTTMVMGVVKQTGANTLSTAEDVKAMVNRLNESLTQQGLRIDIAHDGSLYIWDSIFQVRDNLILGAILATAILWLFLRSVSSTLVLGTMIPVCMIGTFVLLMFFGRSVNVISLAGLAFAGGMILDNGIVVIENIYRHRTELGKPILFAARDGAAEVWAPILASTLTTLAVFIPILFIQEEAGQLFRDIAYAISFSVALSLLAALTVVPTFASRLMGSLPVKGEKKEEKEPGFFDRLLAPAKALHRLVDPFFGRIARFVSGIFEYIVCSGLRRMSIRLAIIALIFIGFFSSLKLAPPAQYLPTGNRNLMIGFFKLPAGISLDGAIKQLDDMEKVVLGLEELERTFFVMLRQGPIFGVIVKDEYSDKATISGLVQKLNGFAFGRYPFPDVLCFVRQVPVFGGFKGGQLNVDISGPDLDKLNELSFALSGQIRGINGVSDVRPSVDMTNPELQVIPDRERLSDLGMTASDVAESVETLVEGNIVSLYREGGKEYDLKLKGKDVYLQSRDDLASVMLPTPMGDKVRLNEVADIHKRHGPVTIEHLEQERSVTLEVQVAEDVALEQIINDVREKVVNPTLNDLPLEYNITLSGAADDLSRTLKALSGSFLLALLIIYLLMSALFRSFLYPLIIMFSVPLAMTGALLAIRLSGSEFNVITMLGFIILSGIVVNNAILLVDVTLVRIREGASHNKAIIDGVKQRMRPIFMTSVTSVLGMAPLALGHGAGAELYSGLGMAVVGGLVLSTLFTLILIPMLLKLTLDIRDGIAKMAGREDWTEMAIARNLEALDKDLD